jgi:hypothetical protein
VEFRKLMDDEVRTNYKKNKIDKTFYKDWL